NKEISRRTTVYARFAFSRYTDLLALINPGWNIDMNFLMFFHFSGAAACAALFRNDLAGTAAMMTYSAIDHSAKRSVLSHIQLAGAMAVGTRFCFCSRLSSRTMASMAIFFLWNGYISFFSKDGFFKIKHKGILQISTLPWCVGITPAPSTKKHIEYIVESAKALGTAKAAKTLALCAGMAELVILGTFLFIA